MNMGKIHSIGEVFGLIKEGLPFKVCFKSESRPGLEVALRSILEGCGAYGSCPSCGHEGIRVNACHYRVNIELEIDELRKILKFSFFQSNINIVISNNKEDLFYSSNENTNEERMIIRLPSPLKGFSLFLIN
jgi:hypothetical protein